MHPQPLFSIGPFSVYAYGVCMAVGIILCFVFLMITMWRMKFNEDAADKILLIGVFGTGFGIFAAMLFQSVYNFIEDPSDGFKLGGMTFIGGLIGGVVSFLGVYWLYIYVIAPRTNIKFLRNNMNATLTDALPFIPIGIVIAHAFGRLGCLFGGCCYGKAVAEGVWGLPCSQYDNILRVPTQLYEMLFLLALGIVMAVLYFKFRFYYNFGLYAITYGIWRFIIEYFRDDPRGVLIPGVLYPSQIWSIVMVVLGVGYILLQYFVLAKHMKHPELKN
ncbi:MAG: prolipoprotein diacylglyceryl transferase [Clostridia bacterium]|nr:prolipoprotein diacylglyceryl transferase [Clostridia bacterium]